MKALRKGLKIVQTVAAHPINFCEDECYQFDRHEINILHDKICQYLAYLGRVNYQIIRGADKSIPLDTVNLMNSYLEVLDRLKCYMDYGINPLKYGFTEEMLSNLKGQVINKIGIRSYGFKCQNVDESKLQEWILRNPLCVGVEYWKRALYSFPAVFQVEVKEITPKIAEAIYHVKELGREKLNIVVKAMEIVEQKKTSKINVKNITNINKDLKISVKDLTENKVGPKIKVTVINEGSAVNLKIKSLDADINRDDFATVKEIIDKIS